jgi:hypothetical protein
VGGHAPIGGGDAARGYPRSTVLATSISAFGRKHDKDYVFDGADGKASVLDLFARRRQLIIDHFMQVATRRQQRG